MKEILLTEKEMVLWYSLCYYISMARVSFLIKLKKKYALARVFSCEFCEISKNIFFYRTPLVAASVKTP